MHSGKRRKEKKTKNKDDLRRESKRLCPWQYPSLLLLRLAELEFQLQRATSARHGGRRGPWWWCAAAASSSAWRHGGRLRRRSREVGQMQFWQRLQYWLQMRRRGRMVQLRLLECDPGARWTRCLLLAFALCGVL